VYAAALAATLCFVSSATAQENTGGAAPPPSETTGAQAPVEGMPAVPFANEIAAAADRNRVDRLLLVALVRAESNFDPDVTSRAGARGLTQLMPGTARALGLRVDLKRKIDDRIVPAKALDAGARYLRAQLVRFRNKVKLSLAAYNAGPRAVIRHRGLPPFRETRNYVTKVVRLRNEYRAELAAARGG
jgi:soluble lytic murein transglycosylase-like protein